MKRLLLTVVIVLTLSCLSAAQEKPSSIKMAEFNPATDNEEVFLEYSKQLINRLKSEDNDTQGFITVDPRGKWAKKLEKLLPKDSPVRGRIILLERFVFFRSTSGNVEFWFVPAGSEPPYTEVCGACTCPSLDIKGDEVSQPFKNLVFTAYVSGGEQEEESYKWKVTNGNIVSGQGTISITVEPNIVNPGDVTATLEIGGLDPSCNCLNSVTFTTKISPGPDPIH